MTIMKPSREVGIAGYGAYVPRYRLPGSEVSRIWSEGEDDSPIIEKAVAGLDEDAVTMAVEAARNALSRAGISPQQLRAVWVGSESKPYAVKPSGTIVAQAIGATPNVEAADWEFACKAGTETMQASFALVGSHMADYALAIGADTAQGRPNDALEYTAASGSAAYVIGPREDSLAYLEGSYSFVSDTPDFYRRAHERYPRHGGRFTGDPAYFTHVEGAARHLMSELGYTAKDYAAAVLHQPNAKFPGRAAKNLGFAPEQIETGLLVDRIGNTYAGSSMLGLTAVLDVAKPGDRVLLVSFGSGAGSDAFSFVMTDLIAERQRRAPTTAGYIARRREIDYAVYARYRGKLMMH